MPAWHDCPAFPFMLSRYLRLLAGKRITASCVENLRFAVATESLSHNKSAMTLMAQWYLANRETFG
jgi:hypothetical protein